MTHVIDLEGIADDGLGYSVTITAPNSPKSTSSQKSWLVRGFKLGLRPRWAEAQRPEEEDDNGEEEGRRDLSALAVAKAGQNSADERAASVSRGLQTPGHILTTTSVQLTESVRDCYFGP